MTRPVPCVSSGGDWHACNTSLSQDELCAYALFQSEDIDFFGDATVAAEFAACSKPI